MIQRRARGGGAPLSCVLAAVVASGCGGPVLFPKISDISTLPPDERVVIGQIQYAIGDTPNANGDLSQWLPGLYQDSSPRFTYDFRTLGAPMSQRSSPFQKQKPGPRFGSRGGVFAFRVKRGRPVYLDSVMVATHHFLKGNALWTLPINFKLPPADDPCVFVGTIVLTIRGDHAPEWSWWTMYGQTKSTGNIVEPTVVDTYERDRAALETFVQGCDLRKALAVPTPPDELEALLAPIRAQHAAGKAQKERASRESN